MAAVAGASLLAYTRVAMVAGKRTDGGPNEVE
jgi:hypothetical protein